jgi:hypothetical protein
MLASKFTVRVTKISSELRRVILIFLVATAWSGVALNGMDLESVSPNFYIAVNGSDEWSGTIETPNGTRTDGPFLTLQRARDAVREFKKANPDYGPIIVEVGEGVYELDDTLELTSDDGGASPDRPVIWRAKEKASVALSAGRFLKGARPLTESEAPDAINPDVRDNLCVIDLADQNFGDLGSPANPPEFFFQGEPTRIARYPNDGFVKIVGLSKDNTHEVDIRGTKGIAEGKLIFDDERLLKCIGEKELWVRGYWFWDWAEQKHRVASIDADTKTIVLEPPYHSYGYRVGQWFYVFNALCELDEPGEYYIDFDAQKLYFYPTNTEWKDGDFLLTRTSHVVEFKNVSNLIWSGFKALGSRGDAICGSGLDNVTVQKCDIFDVSGSGIALSGRNILVRQCELWYLSRGGIRISGGDRATLEASGNKVIDNYVHDYALVERVYQPGVTINGVGNYAAHNLIENAPHMGMGFGGNENTIEFNEIANVCTESNDAGAIYTGRNWTMRGNVLRCNYLHDIQGFRKNGCVGIYLDDMFSSADIVDNLFVNVTRAAFIGGGRNCKIDGNLFVNCNPALHIDARGAGWAKDHVDGWIKEAKEKGTISGIKYKEEPYLSRYPELASILDDENLSFYPVGCEVTGNVCVGGFWDVNKEGQWQGETVQREARPYLTMENNFVAEKDEGFFVDAARGDYRLKEDSEPARQGFKSLPIEKMGLSSDRMKAKARAWRSRR